MISKWRLMMTVVLSLGLVLGAAAQRGTFRPPEMPGKFNPVVGTGAAYEFTVEAGRKINMEIVVVGKEPFDGKDAYWVETRMDTEHGRMVMKELKLASASGAEAKRRIVQMGAQPPMEVPVDMMAMMGGAPPGQTPHPSQELGTVVGTETVTVPGGTFVCEHYRGAGEGKTSDAWLSSKVSPLGLVKFSRGESAGVLQKVLENQKSEIKGEPQKLEFPGMKR